MKMLKKLIKKIVVKILKNNQTVKDFQKFLNLKNTNFYLRSWLNSWDKGILLKGENIPWMNYGIVSFLIKRLPSDLTNISECSCGSSTLFWSKRCENIYSVDNDQNWLDKISVTLSVNNNINLYFKNLSASCVETINEIDKLFDIVVIDGRQRVNCCQAAFQKLTRRKAIILDNSQRTEYKDGINFI